MSLLAAHRLKANGLSIISQWFDPAGHALCYCLEPGVGRLPHPAIPAGTYPLRLRTIGQKHMDYKARYDANARFGPGWHQGMIEIGDIPGRTAIEFHIGNYIKDTLGCSVCGTTYGKGVDGNYQVSDSRNAYEIAYPIIRDLILAGQTQLSISDAGAEV